MRTGGGGMEKVRSSLEEETAEGTSNLFDDRNRVSIAGKKKKAGKG